MFLMRILGTLLCFFPILSVLLEHQRSPWFIGLLAVNAFIWPSVAWFRARRAVLPLVSEHQNLIIDAAAGGFWIAIMAVSPLPSVVIATILLSDRLSAGGLPLLRKAAAVMVSVFALCWLSQGMAFNPLVSQRTMFATLPLIAIYLIALSVLTDMIASRLRLKSHELERIAMMDPLLDIANRRLLEQRIDSELYKLNQTCHSSALMFIDMDNFKEVNDRFGHKVGDTLLVTVSQILQATSRENDTPARLGGDEFVILLPQTTSDEAKAIAIRIMDAAAAMILLPDRAMICTLSIGIARATPDMIRADDWLKAADDALYHAKREGKNRIFTH
ncbi:MULTISPECIES: sensor domain-containing diguanylate cyclase [unclassified Enterobacter]|uniref:sensor domain-containing diguanylate cyclase n=1 Tax=unclassified Enterobacter TaxID=2608935 RepID=UPI000F4A860E|nr:MULTISPECIES: sensor domain-containing diguanylate cyclase [unclassified Enterobacter]